MLGHITETILQLQKLRRIQPPVSIAVEPAEKVAHGAASNLVDGAAFEANSEQSGAALAGGFALFSGGNLGRMLQ